MAREFKEKAHLKTDLEKLRRGYEHIFEKDKCLCEECEELRNTKDDLSCLNRPRQKNTVGVVETVS